MSFATRLVQSLVLLLTMLASIAVASAVDVTGNWSGDLAGPDGNGMTLKFTFKQTGSTITGSVDSPQGSIDLSGTIDGDKISFDSKMGEMTIHHKGTVTQDEMKLSIKFEGGPDVPESTLTLKRVK